MDGIGVNIDGDGNYVGLWAKPERVETDGLVYITVSREELARLASDASSTFHDGMQHDDCAPCGTSWS